MITRPPGIEKQVSRYPSRALPYNYTRLDVEWILMMRGPCDFREFREVCCTWDRLSSSECRRVYRILSFREQSKGADRIEMTRDTL